MAVTILVNLYTSYSDEQKASFHDTYRNPKVVLQSYNNENQQSYRW
jgi:hypothetical protein